MTRLRWRAAAIVATVVTALAATGFCTPDAAAATTAHTAYTASSDTLTNPDRGLYHYTETNAYADGSGYVPLDPAQLAQWRAAGTSVVFRYYYLERYATQDTLDPAYLSQLAADFATARAAGVRLVIRFAYVQGGTWPYTAPYGDAPVARILGHIAQLAPVLNANADTIEALQAGFIGLWGEWYYTDLNHDPTQPGNLNAADWTTRATILNALLDATDPSISVQVRYPSIKQNVLPTANVKAARVGIHDDCFLASPDDYGTFASDADRTWLASQSATVPVGGETCNVNPPRSQWPSAAADLAAYHWSFLNAEYNTDVLNSWGTGLDEARNRLGYRLRLTSADLPTTAAPGDSLAVTLNLSNDGYAAPFRARPVQLVMQSATATFTATLPADVRTWQPGSVISVATSQLCAPPIAGTYSLYVSLPDASPRLATNPAYSVQLANTGLWDAAHGWNALQQQLQVTGSPAPSGCAASWSATPR